MRHASAVTVALRYFHRLNTDDGCAAAKCNYRMSRTPAGTRLARRATFLTEMERAARTRLHSVPASACVDRAARTERWCLRGLGRRARCLRLACQRFKFCGNTGATAGL